MTFVIGRRSIEHRERSCCIDGTHSKKRWQSQNTKDVHWCINMVYCMVETPKGRRHELLNSVFSHVSEYVLRLYNGIYILLRTVIYLVRRAKSVEYIEPPDPPQLTHRPHRIFNLLCRSLPSTR